MAWDNYFTSPSDLNLALMTNYSVGLVVLSFVISIVCSTISFYIVEVAKKTIDTVTKKIAIVSGALTLGCSVWSMHFIGMLALRICAPVKYSLPITLISMVPSIFASYLAFDLFVNKIVTPQRLAVSGVLVGAGIGTMHYVGMQAMTMGPALRYQPFWFFLSIVVAVALAIFALGIASHHFNNKVKVWQRTVICGTVLGCAVCFMHYLGMYAAVFVGLPLTPAPIAPEGTGAMVVAITLGMAFISINVLGLHIFRYREMAQIAYRENEVQQTLIKKLQETQQQLLHSEKMASVGQLAAGVAHEINNPVAFVSSNIASLQAYAHTLVEVIQQYKNFHTQLALSSDKLSVIEDIDKNADLNYINHDIHNLLNESMDGLKRVKDIVQSLKDFARVGSNEWSNADIHYGLDSTLNIVKNEIKYKAVVEKKYGTLPRVHCIISQLNQVFMNLFINAIHAIEERGVISISTGVEMREKQEWVWIKIQDTGSGIPPEIISRIFDPFFTTKPIGSGTGLGLSLAYGIIKKHHGHIDVESEVGKGTCFTVSLPAQLESQQTDPSQVDSNKLQASTMKATNKEIDSSII